MAPRTARFARYAQQWWSRQLEGGGESGDWRRERDAHAVAAEFRRDAQFELAQARFLLRRPNETVARSVVATLEPAPSPEDADLLVAAVVRAGQTAQRVRLGTAVGAGVTVVAFVVRSFIRRR